MRRITALIATVVLACLAACATSSHIVTGTIRAPSASAQGRVFAAMPAGGGEIGILSGESAGWTSQGEKDMAVAELQKDGAAWGSNGVVISDVGIEASGVTSVRAIAVFIAEPSKSN